MPRQSTAHLDNPHAFAKRLRQARHAAGLSQRELTFQGCSPGYISRLEAGQRQPSLQIVEELASRLGVSADWLAHGQEAAERHEPLIITRARLALRVGQLEQAEALARSLQRKGRTKRAHATALAVHGQIALQERQSADAIDLLEEAVRIDPQLDDWDAITTLANAYLELGRPASAITLLSHAHHQADTQDPAAVTPLRVLLSKALRAHGDTAQADSLLDDLQSRSASTAALAQSYAALTDTYAEAGDVDAAQQHAHAAHTLIDADRHRRAVAETQHELALTMLTTGKPERALDHIEQARLILAATAEPHELATLALTTARTLALLGRTMEAIAIADETTTNHRQLAKHHAALARTLDQQGEPDHAAHSYETAINQLDHSDADASHILTAYAELLERLGRTQEAFTAYKQAAAQRSESAAHVR